MFLFKGDNLSCKSYLSAFFFSFLFLYSLSVSPILSLSFMFFTDTILIMSSVAGVIKKYKILICEMFTLQFLFRYRLSSEDFKGTLWSFLTTVGVMEQRFNELVFAEGGNKHALCMQNTLFNCWQ